MKARLLASLIVAAFACSGAFAQNTDKQEAQTDPKETKTVPGADEGKARMEEAKDEDQSTASKPEEQTPVQGGANQSNEGDTPRQGDRLPNSQN